MARGAVVCSKKHMKKHPRKNEKVVRRGVVVVVVGVGAMVGKNKKSRSAHTTAHEAPGSSGQVGQARATLIRGAVFAFELIN